MEKGELEAEGGDGKWSSKLYDRRGWMWWLFKGGSRHKFDSFR